MYALSHVTVSSLHAAMHVFLHCTAILALLGHFQTPGDVKTPGEMDIDDDLSVPETPPRKLAKVASSGAKRKTPVSSSAKVNVCRPFV